MCSKYIIHNCPFLDSRDSFVAWLISVMSTYVVLCLSTLLCTPTTCLSFIIRSLISCRVIWPRQSKRVTRVTPPRANLFSLEKCRWTPSPIHRLLLVLDFTLVSQVLCEMSRHMCRYVCCQERSIHHQYTRPSMRVKTMHNRACV